LTTFETSALTRSLSLCQGQTMTQRLRLNDSRGDQSQDARARRQALGSGAGHFPSLTTV
jgi:hypothetical protein